ncbi:MAG: ABC transporter transmembrane domain-containing protein [Saprospiraceae bacterium]
MTRAGLRKALQIYKYIKPYKWSFIGGLVLLSFSSLIFMIFPGAAGEMANAANGNPKFDISVHQYGLILFVILVVQGVISYFRATLFAEVSERGMADIRFALYNQMISQPVEFFESSRVGELTSRITADVERLQSAFSTTLAEFIRQLVILISGVIILTFMAPKLMGIMLLTFPLIVILAIIFGRYVRKVSKGRQDALAVANTIVEETFHSFQVVKAFTNEAFETLRYRKSIQAIVDISLKAARIKGVFFIFIVTVLFGGLFFVLWQGALLVEAGGMKVGDLFSFIIYTGIIGGAIASIGNFYTELVSAVGSTERIMDILELDKEVEIDDQDAGAAKIFGEVEFVDVGFSYPSRRDLPVLKDISFHIDPGQKVALVGASGAGKSTIVQLLMRFYAIDSGLIKVDNQDVAGFNITAFRKNLAIVPQEVLLFGGSIRENLLYGKSDATDEELKLAAEKANAWEFISQFPEGLDTIVGDRGIKLSGGQRQRVAIARAILRDPKILILDEATSSLDAESEKLVQEALNFLMEGRTSIIIAHRLSTIRDVDQIFVLDKGGIIEQGTHEELAILVDGVYANLAKLQFQGIEV